MGGPRRRVYTENVEQTGLKNLPSRKLCMLLVIKVSKQKMTSNFKDLPFLYLKGYFYSWR